MSKKIDQELLTLLSTTNSATCHQKRMIRLLSSDVADEIHKLLGLSDGDLLKRYVRSKEREYFNEVQQSADERDY